MDLVYALDSRQVHVRGKVQRRANVETWLAQAASAAGKLQEILKKLNGLNSGDGRVAKAKEYVTQQIKRIKLASIEAI